jgi:Putative zinc-finger
MSEPMQTMMDKERLGAFVDGELSPEEAAEVVMHLADHPGDQAYVDELFAANGLLQAAFGGPITEPVPAAILQTISGVEGTSPSDNRVVAFPAARSTWRLPVVGGLALAAAFGALAVVLTDTIAPLVPGLPQSPDAGLALGPIPQDTVLSGVLERAPAGSPETLQDGREAMVLASLALSDGRMCRELEVIDTVEGRIDYALACRASSGWVIEAAVAETPQAQDEADGFVAASGDGATDLTAMIGAADVTVLDARMEQDAIARGWVD